MFSEEELASITDILDATDDLSDEEFTQKVIEQAREVGRLLIAGVSEGGGSDRKYDEVKENEGTSGV
ncbi:hypothetical protein D3C75_813580 [compost metagenome]